jgi:hypothetical protein
VAALAWPVFAQGQIQDNSFLLEEAYNQEAGVVQHISTFSRMWNSKDWSYTFTQEWPGPWDWRHQFSYTLTGMQAGGVQGSGAGFGDVVLNYRFQALGNGGSRVAFAPRISVMLPTGDAALGRGSGGAGVQTNLPLSVVLHRRLVAHFNAGSTVVPRTSSVGYNLGQSLVFLAHPRLNVLLEMLDSRFHTEQSGWCRVTYLSPGVRWAFNFRNHLQIVPGVAMPMGIGGSAGEKGVFLYLSFEHPFKREG